MMLDREDEGNKSFIDKTISLEEVRQKLRTGWKYDDKILDQYFESCYLNWKIYKGDRTSKQVLKLQALYKQAIYGDNKIQPPQLLDSPDGLKWTAWQKLVGTSSQMAKRRFITYLSEINPLLIDVMPDEKPPPGFPMDKKGISICAKCNTTVGCLRPLLDQHKISLKDQLYSNEELHEPDVFKKWLSNAITNQRCIWGVHKAISKGDAKSFMYWFERTENRGFSPYESTAIVEIVHGLVHHHHELTYDLMKHKDDVDADDYNIQATKALKLKKIYEELSHLEFLFLMPCERKIEVCDKRRIADSGKNHTHRVTIDLPIAYNNSSMEEAIALRVQCQKLGINPCTGVVKDIAHRCELYRKKIEDHYDAIQKSIESKIKNENRTEIHISEKRKVKELSYQMLSKQCSEACNMNLTDVAIKIVRRGGNPDQESPRGITPLLSTMINDSPLDLIENLIKLKVNLNYINRFGMNALMIACRLNNSKLVHVLMRNGASAIARDSKVGYNALHWCVFHGSEEMIKVIIEYLQEGVGDSLRVTRFLDGLSLDGETPLMIAARTRNAIICHLLTTLGANPNIRNNKGRTAAYLARAANWNEIADWLEKKSGVGMSKMETFSDLQFEKQHRFGLIKIKDLIQKFGREYLLLVQNKIGLHPIGCPFITKSLVLEKGDKAIAEQKAFIDNHLKYIQNRDYEEYKKVISSSTINSNTNSFNNIQQQQQEQQNQDKIEQRHKEIQKTLNEMLELMRKGIANPNAESIAKPLAFTPLMCAVAACDLRVIKLMIREGAHPDHPNKDGMTAVMLASQLQNIEVLTELLLSRPSEALKCLMTADSQGYTALAYATSLPLPTIMERNAVGVLMDRDTDGPRPMTSAQLITLALAGSLSELREALVKDHEESLPEKVDEHYKLQYLLELNGLSSINNTRNIQDSVKSSVWRLKQPKEKRSHKIKHNLSQAEKDDDKLSTAEKLRCPLCTLPIPCLHFFSETILKQFMSKQLSFRLAMDIAQDEANIIENADNNKKKAYVSDKKLRIMSRNEDILNEALIGDRKTDRSLAFVNKFRPREKELELAKIISQQLNNDKDELEQDDEDEDANKEVENKEIHMIENLTLKESNDIQPLSPSLASRRKLDHNNLKQSIHSQSFATQITAISDLTSVTFTTYSDIDTVLVDDEVVITTVISNQATTTTDNTIPVYESKDVTQIEEEVSSIIENSSSSLKSSLKPTSDSISGISHAGDNSNNALVEFKKKRRVKFYLPSDENIQESNIPVVSEVEGTTMIEDSSVYSESTNRSTPLIEGEKVHKSRSNSILITSSKDFIHEQQIQLPLDINDNTMQGNSITINTSIPIKDNIVSIEQDQSNTNDIDTSSNKIVNKDKDNLNKTLHMGESPVNKSEGINPIPIHKRKVFMFTKNFIHRFGETDALLSPTTITKTSKSIPNNKNKLKENNKALLNYKPLKVQISGWIFVSLADIKSDVSLLDSIVISLENWGTILELQREKFMEDFLPNIQLEPVVSIKTWQSTAPRCSVCAVGFVRLKSSLKMYSEDPMNFNKMYTNNFNQEQNNNNKQVNHSLDSGLCLACALKKDLFIQSQQFFPASISNHASNLIWPLINRSSNNNSSNYIDNSNGDKLEDALKANQIVTIDDNDDYSLDNEDGNNSDFGSFVSSISGGSYNHHHSSSNLQIYYDNNNDNNTNGLNSPIKSQKLVELDFQESWEKVNSPDHYHATLFNNNINNNSNNNNSNNYNNSNNNNNNNSNNNNKTKSINVDSSDSSKLSNITNSIDEKFKEKYGPKKIKQLTAAEDKQRFVPLYMKTKPDDTTTTTMDSTITIVNPMKKPKELALIPFLISKGHYEEAERTLRIAIGKKAVDEGEGLKILISLLKLQAEMYKNMGLWSLAIAIYLDCIDLTASLMGYNDASTYNAIILLVSCLRKMQCIEIAGKYIKKLCQHFERNTLKSFRLEIIQQIKDKDEANVKEYLTLNSIWTNKLKKLIPLNNSKLSNRFHSVIGIGGLYSLLTSQDGYSIVARTAFYQYCMNIDKNTIGNFAKYVDCCFRLRIIDEPQMYRYVIQYMTQKMISKTLVSTSELARLYRIVTSKEHINLVIDFFQFGQQPTVEVFDALLEYVLNKLLKIYRIFLLFDPAGYILRDNRIDIIAEAYDVSATMIQCLFRRVKAKQIFKHKQLVYHQNINQRDIIRKYYGKNRMKGVRNND